MVVLVVLVMVVAEIAVSVMSVFVVFVVTSIMGKLELGGEGGVPKRVNFQSPFLRKYKAMTNILTICIKLHSFNSILP